MEPILHPGEIHVWRVAQLPAKAALHAILPHYTAAPLDFGANPHGKPYLCHAPEIEFNLSHSQDRALVAVALAVPVGVDIERLRPMPDCLAVGERFFPPSDAAALAAIPPDRREAAFFRRWTRIEAMSKARGVGLSGAGVPLDGDWTVESIDAGEGFAAAVAATRAGMTVSTYRVEFCSLNGRIFFLTCVV